MGRNGSKVSYVQTTANQRKNKSHVQRKITKKLTISKLHCINGAARVKKKFLY